MYRRNLLILAIVYFAIAGVILVVLLSGCSIQQIEPAPIDHGTFEQEFSRSFQPEITAGFVDVPWTAWNRAWFASAIAGQSADVISTQVALDDGCAESNGLYGSDPSAVTMVAVKSAVLGLSYYVIEYVAVFDTVEDQQDARNYTYAILTALGAGPAIYNSSVDCH